MNITEQQIEVIKKATNENEFNKACDGIKSAHGGQYPDDWYAVVILGGLCPDPNITIRQLKRP